MCAIDREISTTAARLAKVIASAPSSCLAPDDRSVVADMKRLSKPVPECAKPVIASKLDAKAKPVAARAALVRTKAASKPAEARSTERNFVPGVELGLMSDLY
jgi:hypothetical protein